MRKTEVIHANIVPDTILVRVVVKEFTVRGKSREQCFIHFPREERG